MNDRLQRVLEALKAKPKGENRWEAHCPGHEDSTPSLEITVGDDGRILAHDFGGCSFERILSASGLDAEDFSPPRDVTEKPKRERKAKPHTLEAMTGWSSTRAIYDYQDETGKSLFVVRRHVDEDGKKTFRQYRALGDGRYLAGMQGVRRVPYRLPEVLTAIRAGRPVFIVEGEKDVESLRARGLVATCNPGGAGKWTSDNAEHLQGAVGAIILPDNDAPGADHARQIASTLQAVGVPVRILELPGLRPKGDVSDWLEAGGTVEQLQLLAERATPISLSDDTDTGEEATDLGNARRLVVRHGRDLRYSSALGWLVYEGRRWERDDTGEVTRRAIESNASLFAEAADPTLTRRERDEKVEHAKRSQSARSIEAAARLARVLLPVRPDHLDVDPWALNVENGTLDLRTGQLHEHRRDDFLTKLAPVRWDPDALCPLWRAFLERVMGGKQTLIQYLVRLAGYSLTGSTREEKLFVLHGSGRNGKGVFTETLAAVLGEYATRIPSEMLLEQKQTNAGGPTPHIARLKGARFAYASETTEGRRLAEGLVKELTGGDTLSARHLHGEFFDFRPAFKVALSTNHRPTIRGTDEGIWSRIHLVPFEVFIPEHERDPELKRKLRGELPGILRLFVEGCLQWQRLGLQPPPEVLAAVTDYRAESDTIGAFLEERCLSGPGASDSARRLYDAYRSWCEAAAETPISPNAFGRALTDRGYTRNRSATHRRWSGLQLRDDSMTHRDTGIMFFAHDAHTEIKPDSDVTSSHCVTAPPSVR